MRRMSRMFSSLFWGVGIFCVITPAAAQAQTPAGSVAFETAEDSSGMDTIWAGCVLVTQGKKYTCTLSGLQAPLSSGVTRVSGMAYDLKDVAAFAGVYKPTSNDLSLGGGHLTVKNQDGVMLILSAFGDLVELKAADAGMVIKLKE